jgi:hypothetical protein
MRFEKQSIQFATTLGYHPMNQYKLMKALHAASKGLPAEFRYDLEHDRDVLGLHEIAGGFR